MKNSTHVQSIIFSKENYTKTRAIKFLKKNNFHTTLDETKASFRARQAEPNRFLKSSFRTITIKNGLKMVIGKLK